MRIDLGPGRCIKPKSSYLPAPSLTAPQCDNMKRNLKMLGVVALFLVVLSSVGVAATTNLYFSYTGWNFVSIPIKPNRIEPPNYPDFGSVDIRSVVCNSSQWGGNGGGCTEVYFYNSTDQKWYHWDKSKPDNQNSLTVIKDGYGYWINVNKMGYMNDIKGIIIDPINDPVWNTMQSGWNMMGWTNLDPLVSDTVPQIEAEWGKEIARVWHYDENSFDLISDYWPDNDSAVFKGQIGYWDCVYDPGDPTFCEETVPPLMPWQNQWPKLNETFVTRTFAEGIKFQYKYIFSVKYSDSDNDAPSTAIIYVDGIAHDMGEVQPTGEGEAPPNYIEGVVYEYKEILDFGEHTYSFEFDDGKSHIIYEPRGGNKNYTIDVKLPFAVAEPISAKAWMIKELRYIGSNVNSTCGHEINLTGISQMGSDFYASFLVMYNDVIETGSIEEGNMDTFFSGSLKIKVANIRYLESLVVVHIQCE